MGDLSGDRVLRLPQNASREDMVEAVAALLASGMAPIFRACVRDENFEMTREIARRFGVRVIPGAPHRVGEDGG